MSDEIRICCDRFFRMNNCPRCGESGSEVISKDKEVQVSKFLTGILRHFPEDYNVELDDSGWADVQDVSEATKTKYNWMSRRKLMAIIEMDSDGRYELDDGRVRASYGHNSDLDINLESTDYNIPDNLYHATAPENVESIIEGGLKPMSRKMVHMSSSKEDAISKGRRYADNPDLLVVDSKALIESGHDVNKRGKTTFTTEESIPSEFIRYVVENPNS